MSHTSYQFISSFKFINSKFRSCLQYFFTNCHLNFKINCDLANLSYQAFSNLSQEELHIFNS